MQSGEVSLPGLQLDLVLDTRCGWGWLPHGDVERAFFLGSVDWAEDGVGQRSGTSEAGIYRAQGDQIQGWSRYHQGGGVCTLCRIYVRSLCRVC